MSKFKDKQQQLTRRRARARARVSGTADRPRLSVFVSNRYIYTQLIDDRSGQTIVGLHLKSIKEAPTTVGAEKLGRALAGQAKERQISRVVFDRGARAYAGRVQALAEGARAGGLEF